ncbi:MAG: TlpA disulfide reductase family protein [Planctomycetota bacterium]
MLNRLVLSALVVSLAGTVYAQPTPTTAPKKDEKQPSVPATKIEPKKDDKKDEKKKVEPTLKVGSAAPALSANNWVKGKEVKSFEKGKVYVVEFWATWCGPCLTSIPHLTETAKAHSDVTFIGMASSERAPKDGAADERLTKIEKFVKDQGDKMGYTVAYDADRKMSKGWMEPAGQGGIPCAFIVDGEGKIAFIGHPMDGKFAEKVNELSKFKVDLSSAGKKDEPKKNEKKEAPKDTTKK